MRIAIIGTGVSGIAAASILKRFGHDVTLFEKSSQLGGVWAVSYPGVALQNIHSHYMFSEFPWPNKPDYHPTGAQIMEYVKQTVEYLQLDVRLSHPVIKLDESEQGWNVTYQHQAEQITEVFDYVVLAIGQYTEWKNAPAFPGQDEFSGTIITERDVKNLDIFNDKTTAVVGFGKSAVDMASAAVSRSKQVHHVFRTPRWLIPFYILGLHYSHVMFCRMGTFIMKSWAHPSKVERFLHNKLSRLVDFAWVGAAHFFRWLSLRYARGLDEQAQQRMLTVLPNHGLVGDLRSATAMAPVNYYNQVSHGQILPHHGELKAFSKNGLLLNDGTELHCDQVLLCVGSETPKFPFLPEKYRCLLEKNDDGVQLYRHIIHPRIPKLAFAGYNHGFMHIPTAEVGTLWLCAVMRGEIELPSVEEMEASIIRVRSWKQKYINYEPSRSCAVNTRFQQYIDILLLELGLSPYRKMPNIFAELFAQYGSNDYRDLVGEYQAKAKDKPRRSLPLDT